MKNVLYSLFGVIAGFILAGILLFVSRAPAGEPIVLQPAPTQEPITVHVLGGVARPGLYKLTEGARIQDAIDAAGGLLTIANADTLNLAKKLEDGEQLNIPCKDDACVVGEDTTTDLPNEVQEGEPVIDENGYPVELINVNSATLEELDTLTGIGPEIAQRIIEYRELYGCFYIPEDLLNVEGIGEAKLEGIRDKITTDYCP